MSSDNMTGAFQCQEVGHMACYCPHIQCYDCDNYGHVMPWTAQIRYCHLVHQHAAGLTPTTGVERSSSKHATVTPDTHAMITGTDLDSVVPDLTPVTTDTGVVAARILHRSHSRSFHRPSHCSCLTSPGALVLTATAMTCLTADLHLIGIPPEMTADLNINPGDNTTDQPRDLHPLHRHHLGNIRTRDTNRSQLMTHHQSTTAQMTMEVTQRMI